MADCSFGKTNVSVIFVKFTPKDGFDIVGNVTSIQYGLEA